MNILILGGAGFLGNNLIRRCLLEPDHSITVVDSLHPKLKSTTDYLQDIIDQVDFIEGDMADQRLMEKLIKDTDVIFNCAGQTSHPLSLKDPFLDVEINCKGNITLLEAVKNVNKDAQIIYTSSSTVIGRAENDIVDEDHGEAPLDIYSANKGVVEKYYRIYNRVYDLKTISIRFANLYGPYGKCYPEFGFINYFIALAEEDKDITIYGDGKQNRNVMFVEDACDLLYQTINKENLYGNLYFGVHREHYSVADIAKEIVRVFKKGKIKHIDWPDVRKRIEIDNVIISAAKLYYELKFEPNYNLYDGLVKTKETIEHYRASQLIKNNKGE